MWTTDDSDKNRWLRMSRKFSNTTTWRKLHRIHSVKVCGPGSRGSSRDNSEAILRRSMRTRLTMLGEIHDWAFMRVQASRNLDRKWFSWTSRVAFPNVPRTHRNPLSARDDLRFKTLISRARVWLIGNLLKLRAARFEQGDRTYRVSRE